MTAAQATKTDCSSAVTAAHCAVMNTSPVNRQPQGIPTGGQYAASTHSETALDLQAPADLPLILDPGESEDYSEYADGDVITRLSVLRSDDGGTFHVEASKFLNLKDIIPAGDLRTDEAGRDAWLDANSPVIEDFFRRRYGAETDATDWDDVRIECSVSIQADSVTGPQVANEVWNRSGIVQLHNESDHGTFGSENMGRLLREHVQAQAVVKDIPAVRAAAARRTAADINTELHDRKLSGRNLSDATAMAIARTLDPIAYPEVRSLGRSGFGGREALKSELLSAYEKAHATTDRASIGMMLAWLVNGGDNS